LRFLEEAKLYDENEKGISEMKAERVAAAAQSNALSSELDGPSSSSQQRGHFSVIILSLR